MSRSAPLRFVWLLRHAKAASDAPKGGGDHERPLTARGRSDATALGRRLAGGPEALGLGQAISPQAVLCSSATRTRQTAELALGTLPGHPPAVDVDRSLYGAGVETVVACLQEVDDEAGSVLLVGHNPTIYGVAWELVGDAAARDRLAEHGFPTCSLAVVGIEIDSWSDLREGAGSLAGVFSPPY